MKTTAFCAAALLVCTTFAFGADEAKERQQLQRRLEKSTAVFAAMAKTDDKGVPQRLLSAANCVVVVPDLRKAAFVVGGSYGKGFMTCRNANGWSGPSAIKIEGGSIGAQIGVNESELLLVVTNEEGKQSLMKTEFKLGGEVGLTAGPVGRTSEAQTDGFLKAGILSYSRSEGAFAGIALKGSTLREDHDENVRMYGREVTHEDVLLGKVPSPAVARSFLSAVRSHTAAAVSKK